MAQTIQKKLTKLETAIFNLSNVLRFGIHRNFNTSLYFNNPFTWKIKESKRISKLQFFSSCYNKCPENKSPKISKTELICPYKPSKWPSGIKINFKFHPETEDIMNEQINAEFKAFYYYLSMVDASYFGRVDVALPGCESFFTQMHHEEHCHALKLINYVKLRGGSAVLYPINPPDDSDWKCPINAFRTALDLEMEVAEKLVLANTIAEKHEDLNASDFIITYYMQEQMKSINEIARIITVLSGVGDDSLARFIFDKELLRNYATPQFQVFKNFDVFKKMEETLKIFKRKNKGLKKFY